MTQGDLFGKPKALNLDELGQYLGGLMSVARPLTFAFVVKTLIEPGYIRQSKDDAGEPAFLVVNADAVKAWAVEMALVPETEWPTRVDVTARMRQAKGIPWWHLERERE